MRLFWSAFLAGSLLLIALDVRQRRQTEVNGTAAPVMDGEDGDPMGNPTPYPTPTP